MRYTVVEAGGVVSFIADCDSLASLIAACSMGASNLSDLLKAADKFDPRIKEFVATGLAVFDEHNTTENPAVIHEALDFCRPFEVPTFRVVDERTRQASLQPVKAGLIIFNLPDRRIVQVVNTFEEIRRKGRVRLHDGRRLTGQVYSYELSADWSLVPDENRRPV